MPTVSVIMPAYNVEPYLDDAAASVLRQTYADLELVIVNDGSTDNTEAIAKRIEARDPERVRVITGPHIGLPAARNVAMRAARGEFFALLDSDDVWERGFVERLVTQLMASPDVDLVTGNGRFLGSSRHGKTARPSPDPRPPISLATIISDEQAVFIMTVFRRRVFDTIGGFDESLETNEDFDYWLRAALAGFRFARCAEPLAWYRQRDDSLSANAVRMYSGVLRVCAKRRALLEGRSELALLDEKVAYYQAELDAASARQALAACDMPTAVAALASLNARRPSVRNAIAAIIARYGGTLLATLYQLKLRARQMGFIHG